MVSGQRSENLRKPALKGWVLIAPLAVAVWANSAQAAEFDFESPAAGTTYGVELHSPGQVVFATPEGIAVSVENFLAFGQPDFNIAQIHAAGMDGFATQHIFLDNISLAFDLSGLGFAVEEVRIEFREGGGIDNFSVNGQAIIELPALSDMPMNIAPGVIATVIDDDSIHLSGLVSRFLIGGQELAVDNIVAVPEPAAVTLLGALALRSVLLRRRRA